MRRDRQIVRPDRPADLFKVITNLGVFAIDPVGEWQCLEFIQHLFDQLGQTR
jgi:hypothetical protein